ncbi:MAG TPA: DUF1036 domain-containing protein [Xanthobacteraceae bacterium]|nr:DUF1036 domain-containing protein [Xanthobacteraceae bacterium]
MQSLIRNARLRLAAQAAGLVAAILSRGATAHADLQLCNRMSYVVQAALGLEHKNTVTTRGWFRIDPGQCRNVLQGDVEADGYYLHAQTLPLYGTPPLPQAGHVELCVSQDDFTIPQARRCGRPGERLARFIAVKPSAYEQGLSASFAEEAEYTGEQARDAGIQRLLVIAGYDATPIDGVRGPKFDAALIRFLQDNKLPPTAAARSDFFDILIAAAQRPGGTGFSWCNDTAYPVMAAIGFEEDGAVTTRGWYRVAPGACVRPELPGRPKRIYSFAEAVDAKGNALTLNDRPLRWGGSEVLCTRQTRFELSDQQDCKLKGLNPAGFAVIELGSSGTTVRFK